MLTSHQMELALRAVSQISEQSLTVISLKLIEDIRCGKYEDGHCLTSRVRVGDLRAVPLWWQNIYYVALIVASASGNLTRMTCRSVGVNPVLGDWKQLLTLCTSNTACEVNVATALIRNAIASSNAGAAV